MSVFPSAIICSHVSPHSLTSEASPYLFIFLPFLSFPCCLRHQTSHIWIGRSTQAWTSNFCDSVIPLHTFMQIQLSEALVHEITGLGGTSCKSKTFRNFLFSTFSSDANGFLAPILELCALTCLLSFPWLGSYIANLQDHFELWFFQRSLPALSRILSVKSMFYIFGVSKRIMNIELREESSMGSPENAFQRNKKCEVIPNSTGVKAVTKHFNTHVFWLTFCHPSKKYKK